MQLIILAHKQFHIMSSLRHVRTVYIKPGRRTLSSDRVREQEIDCKPQNAFLSPGALELKSYQVFAGVNGQDLKFFMYVVKNTNKQCLLFFTHLEISFIRQNSMLILILVTEYHPSAIKCTALNIIQIFLLYFVQNKLIVVF